MVAYWAIEVECPLRFRDCLTGLAVSLAEEQKQREENTGCSDRPG